MSKSTSGGIRSGWEGVLRKHGFLTLSGVLSGFFLSTWGIRMILAGTFFVGGLTGNALATLFLILDIVTFIFLRRLCSPLLSLRNDINKGHIEQIHSPYTEIEMALDAIRDQRAQSEELDSLRARREREQSQYLASITHELRTPLTSIVGYAEMLDGDIGGKISEEQHKWVRTMLSSIDRLMSAVNDTIDISKIDCGKMIVDIAEVNPLDVVLPLEDEFGPKLVQRQQSLTVSVDPTTPNVLADSFALSRVLTNLVSNASKYTQIGGAIQVAVRRNGECVEFSVSDNGFGITPENLQEGKLFSKFYQTRGEDARVGSGLGLAIVKELLGLMGGTIRVHSAVGDGSVFTVSLPAAEKANDAEQAEKPIQ